MTEFISAPRPSGYRTIRFPQNGLDGGPAEREEPAVPDLFGSGVVSHQLLALGLVGAFVGAVRILDALYHQSAMARRDGFDGFSSPSNRTR